MEFLDCRKIKIDIFKYLKNKIDTLDRKLGLAVIQIGDDEASSVYINQKRKMALELGYEFNYIKLNSDISEDYVLKLIDRLNNDDMVDGIVLQLPIPKYLDSDLIRNRISPVKDVDGITDVNLGKLLMGNNYLVSCTALGIMDILKYYDIDVLGANVVVVGRSVLVGKSVFNLLINNDATVTLCHSKTRNLADITSRADILIVGVGKDNFVTDNMVKTGAVIIDVGINMVDGKVCGDVCVDSVKDKVKYITPVPFGVGQVTVAELAKNVYRAYKIRNIED